MPEREYYVNPGGESIKSARNGISPPGTIATFHKHGTDFLNAAKIRSRGRAAMRRYPQFGDHPGQCLVLNGFETRIGRADKAIPILSKKFSIHTLGQTATFSTAWFCVWNAAVSRHSAPNVGYAYWSGRPDPPIRERPLQDHHALRQAHRPTLPRLGDQGGSPGDQEGWGYIMGE
jgi:hypothetical protein